MAKSKGILKSIANKGLSDAEKLEHVHLNEHAQKIMGIKNVLKQEATKDNSPADGEVHLNLKYFDSSFECFSEWSKEDLKAFSGLIDKLKERNWDQIKKTGGSAGHKQGLGFTALNEATLPKSIQDRLKTIKQAISSDISISELRVHIKARVHGFRLLNGFYVIWLDKDHRVC